MMPDLFNLYEVVDHTWPTHHKPSSRSWILRQGRGEGKRVSVATLQDRIDTPDISFAKKAMLELGHDPLFIIRDVDKKLEQMLDDGAYKFIDAVNIYCTSCKSILRSIPLRLNAFDIWESPEIPIYIWARVGIDKSRDAVMKRADCNKTSLLMLWDNDPAGAVYIGIYNGIVIVNAQEILPSQGCKGVGAIAIRHAEIWARAQNAPYISVICAKENKAADVLYTSLKMHPVGGYH